MVLKNYINFKMSTNVICDVSFPPYSVVKWGICCEQVCPTVVSMSIALMSHASVVQDIDILSAAYDRCF